MADELVDASSFLGPGPALAGHTDRQGCATLQVGRRCGFPRTDSKAFQRLTAVTGLIRHAALVSPHDPQSRWLVAQAELVWASAGYGDPAAAEGILRALATEQPTDVRVWIDLSAARLEEATKIGRPAYYVAALDAAARALRLDSLRLEAYVNQALALEGLGLSRQAVSTWNRVHRMRPQSAWSDVVTASRDEWHARLELVAGGRGKILRAIGDRGALAQLVAAHPQVAREIVLDSLIPAWGDQAMAGERAMARRTLTTAREVAATLSDRSIGQVVADLERAEPGAVPSVWSAASLFGRGRSAYANEENSEARSSFRAARAQLGEASPSLAAWIDLWLASIALAASDATEVERRLGPLLEPSGLDAHSLVALAGWIAGVSEGRAGRYERALTLHTGAAELAELSGEPQLIGFLWRLVAEGRKLLGDAAGSWAARVRGFQAFRPGLDDAHEQSSLLEASEAAEREGWHHAAWVLQDAGVSLAVERGAEANLMAEALVRRAERSAALGDTAAGRADLGRARSLAHGISKEDARQRTLADVWRAEAHFAEGIAEKTRAVEALDSAIGFFEGRDTEHFLLDLYVARSRLNRARGEPSMASADLESAIAAAEARRREIESLGVGYGFAEALRGLRTDVVSIREGADRDVGWAITQLDRVTRIAHDWAPAASTSPEALFRLGHDVAVVGWAATRDRGWAWLATEDGLRDYDLPTGGDSIAAAVARLRQVAMAARGVGDTRTAAVGVSQLLLPPALIADAGERDIVVVWSPEIADIPLALLRDTDERLLIESRSLALTVSLGAMQIQRRSSTPVAGPLLVDAGPRREVAGFSALPWAEAEIEALAAGLPRAEKMGGGTLTPAGLLEALRQPRSYFHFAGHAVTAAAAAGGGFLALPDGPDHVHRLTAEEIAAADISGPRLVVLSACQSVAATGIAGGFHGVAIPFLRAGSQTVVGSVWPVRDEAAARFAVEIGGASSSAESGRERLRAAQLRASRDPAFRVADWSGFTAVIRR